VPADGDETIRSGRIIVPEFVVERDIPGFTTDDLREAAKRATSVAGEMTAEGTPVRYLRSIFLPDQAKCFCLFEGPSAAAVQEVNERAKLPFTRVVNAVHIELSD